ncbi:TPA: hypothetical protein F8A22_15985 [Legionella pneumophila]|nr:hypothetical protein [Legionella pneumophila]HAU2337859.1 hypothetical protein [Legionella pneumophila]HAU2378794.1 hypothetical protein [Legionella pneumophila]HAU2503218.1 hypothetical protein [Legionella pneumophila]HAU3545712.1 hypothetical protein [Legionella pneumophila]
MKHSPRLYYCALCHAQSIICSHCDRGQIYCSYICAREARLKSCREAEKRYQHTSRGKHKHAARQKRYRERLRQKVTDQGSVTPVADGLLRSVKNKTVAVDSGQEARVIRCCFCKNPVSSWLRSGFLRYDSTRSAINSSYLRPP